MLNIHQQRNLEEGLFSGLSICLMAGVLVGSTWTYAIHGIVFLFACRLLLRDPDWRARTCRYFTNHRVAWGLMVAFSVVFLVPFLFSSVSAPADASELKWTLVFLALLMPSAAVFRTGGVTRSVRVAMWMVVGLILISALDGAVQIVTGRNPLREWMGAPVDTFGGMRRATGILRNPIPFGHSMGAFFWTSAAGVLICWLTGRRRLALMAIAVGCAAFMSVLFSQTRGAWLAIAMVSVVSIPILTGKQRRFWINCLGIAALLGIIGVALHADTRMRLASAFDPNDKSNSLRLELWQANVEILKDHPFGVGYNANDQLIENAYDKLGFETHSWMGHSHNEFVEIAVGSGWLGIGLYLALSGWLLWIAIKAFRQVDVISESWAAFILLSSILIQLFVNACALTDQMSTPGRFLLCMAWAVAIVVPVERSWRSSGSGHASEMDGGRNEDRSATGR